MNIEAIRGYEEIAKKVWDTLDPKLIRNGILPRLGLSHVQKSLPKLFLGDPEEFREQLELYLYHSAPSSEVTLFSEVVALHCIPEDENPLVDARIAATAFIGIEFAKMIPEGRKVQLKAARALLATYSRMKAQFAIRYNLVAVAAYAAIFEPVRS